MNSTAVSGSGNGGFNPMLIGAYRVLTPLLTGKGPPCSTNLFEATQLVTDHLQKIPDLDRGCQKNMCFLLPCGLM